MVRKPELWLKCIIKTYRKQQQAEIAYAIESHKCPRCGAPILQKSNTKL